jgi:hypothetical protein
VKRICGTCKWYVRIPDARPAMGTCNWPEKNFPFWYRPVTTTHLSNQFGYVTGWDESSTNKGVKFRTTGCPTWEKK